MDKFHEIFQKMAKILKKIFIFANAQKIKKYWQTFARISKFQGVGVS